VNCREFTELAAAWLDGEVPGEQRAAAGEHLAECDQCARLLEDLAAVDRAVKEQPAVERAESEWEGFNRKLMVRIAMEGREAGEAGEQPRRPARRILRWGWRVAVAASALIVAGWVGSRITDKPPIVEDPMPYRRSIDLDGLSYTPAMAAELGLPPGIEIDVPVPSAEDREKLDRLLSASERILVRLKNADLKDSAELAAIRSAVIDTGLVTRLSAARGSVGDADPLGKGARPVEMVLRRVSNGSPEEPEEFAAIQSAVLDNALVERTRKLRFGK
jgi:Putative zinc-finger